MNPVRGRYTSFAGRLIQFCRRHFRTVPRRRTAVAAGLLAVMAALAIAEEPTTQPARTATTQPAQEAATRPTSQPAEKPKRVEYAPHVTIDWSVPQVEVDAHVVLREGLLELLLCADNTKEHESILATAAEPLKIFEAMGLIGLEPGHPVRFEAGGEKVQPATGERLAIDIEYEHEGVHRSFAAHEWMVKPDSLEPIEALPWVFAGSSRIDGKFGANMEGTIVCVVDFSTALIALAQTHSSSDAELWVAANTRLVPERGTQCKLIISKLQSAPLVLTLTPEGFFWLNNEILSPLELDAIIRKRTLHYPDQAADLTPMPGTDKAMARLAAVAIIGSGIKRQNMTLHLPPEEEAAASPSPKPTATRPATPPAPTAAPKPTPAPSASAAPSPTPSPTPSPRPTAAAKPTTPPP